MQTGSYGVYAVTVANRFGATQTSFDLEAPERLVLTLERRLPNDMQLHVRGSDNLEFSIELSADLRTWQPGRGASWSMARRSCRFSSLPSAITSSSAAVTSLSDWMTIRGRATASTSSSFV